jgi:hypothetical protein
MSEQEFEKNFINFYFPCVSVISSRLYSNSQRDEMATPQATYF